MTDRRTNRLTDAATGAGKLLVGTPQALTQLYEHCARLNAMCWIIASGRPYIVRKSPEKDSHEIVRQGEISEKPANAVRNWQDAA